MGNAIDERLGRLHLFLGAKLWFACFWIASVLLIGWASSALSVVVPMPLVVVPSVLCLITFLAVADPAIIGTWCVISVMVHLLASFLPDDPRLLAVFGGACLWRLRKLALVEALQDLPVYLVSRIAWYAGIRWYQSEQVQAYAFKACCMLLGKRTGNVLSMPDAEFLNWNGAMRCVPSITFCATSLDDLVQATKWAHENCRKMRIRAQGHTTSSLLMSPADDLAKLVVVDVRLLSGARMDETAPPGEPRVIVRAGTSTWEMDRLLEAQGLSLPTNTLLSCFRMCGVVAMGCHGAGVDYPGISDYVHSLTFVKADGSLEVVSEETHGCEVMSAARVHLGLLGIVYEMSIKVQQSEVWRVEDQFVNVDELLADRDRIRRLFLTPGSWAELMWFPSADEFWIKHAYRVPDEGQPHVRWRESRVLSEVSTAVGVDPLFSFWRFAKWLNTSWSLRLYTASHWRSNKQWVLSQHHLGKINLPTCGAIHYSNLLDRLHCELSEYVFQADPDLGNVIDLLQECVTDLRALRKAGQVPVSLVVEFRICAGSTNCMLSPLYAQSSGQLQCGFEFISMYGTPGFDKYCAQRARQLYDDPKFQARPHWAKKLQVLSDDELIPRIRKSFGLTRLRRFEAIRRKFDPDNVFLGPLLGKVLRDE